MKLFLYLYLVPFFEIVGIAILIGVLLAIILSVVIFGERENLEKDKDDD